MFFQVNTGQNNLGTFQNDSSNSCHSDNGMMPPITAGPGGGSGSPRGSNVPGLPVTHHPPLQLVQSNNNAHLELPLNNPSLQQTEPSPEKPVTSARTPTERKRKRKNASNQNQNSSQANLAGALASAAGLSRSVVQGTESETAANHPASASAGNNTAGAVGDINLNNKGTKKINDYFKHTPSSPVRSGLNPSGAKSPLPFSAPGLYPPSPKAQYVGSPSPVGGLAGVGVGTGGSGSGPGSGSTTPPEFATLMQPPKLPAVSKGMQTDMGTKDIANLESHSANELEAKESRIEELQRVNEELTRQLSKTQKEVEDQKSTIQKCLSVAKELLIEKSTIERKDARAKCMQNRLRLGQFVTKRVGATFQENWTDGYAFQELAKRQEEIANERDEIDRKKKKLTKSKPADSNGPGRKRASKVQGEQSSDSGNGSDTAVPAVGATGATGSGAAAATGNAAAGGNLSGTPMSGTSGAVNGSTDETLFTKPPPRDGMTMQEYYEAEEILRLRHNTLKKEDAEMQLEMEKLERARNLHIRELKRIHNEDQSRYELDYFWPNSNNLMFILAESYKTCK